MRVQLVEPQKKIECGICKSDGNWIKRINVRGVSGLYCIKCDTLTVFEPIVSKYLYQAFQDEVRKIRQI